MFNEFLKDAVLAISANHSLNEKISFALSPLRAQKAPDSEELMVVPVFKKSPSFSVAGVDSGFASKRLSFMELLLVKTAGVVFNFKNGSLVSSIYYPTPFSFPKPLLLRQGLERDEEAQSISLIRLKEEVLCAIEVIQKFKPEFMFIDGSIVPQYQDKPRGDSELNSDYHSIITLFARLYKVAEQNFTTLVACVEDSRGTRFRQILQDDILSKDSSSTPSSQNSLNQKNLSSKIQLSASILNSSFDASILDYYLRQGERTFAFSYTNSPSSHAILKDYSPEWAKSVFVFYLKATEFDRPLRVEFLCKDKNNLKECANRIASIVYSLSSLHREYSFPSILIEADLRAGLSEQEINVVYERLIDKLGSKIRMRRNNRPFG